MRFHEKLDFLLKLTDTTNKQLACAISVDPSLISRMRTGSRTPSRACGYSLVMGDYFAKKCTTEFQHIALAETIGQNRIRMIKKKEQIAEIISQWLEDTSPEAFQNMQRMINEQALSEYSNDSANGAEELELGQKSDCYIYFGNDGKRQAFHNFVLYLLKYGKPCTIFLSSDESLEWMMERDTFLRQQRSDYIMLTDAGFSFVRIVPKYADTEEAVASFSRWLPIYMRGKCEVYYYPRIRDNVFHRTLFVAPGQIAMCSNSVGYHVENDLTYLYTDPFVANNVANEFNDYYKKCIPMSISYTHSSTERPILDCLIQYLDIPGDMVTKFYGLPSLVTPTSVIKKVFGSDKKNVEALNILAQKCHVRLAADYLTDVITLDLPQDIYEGKALCTTSLLAPGVHAYYYTTREYIEHLQAVIMLLNEYPNYTVIVNEDNSDMRSTICTIESGKCYIIRIKEPVTLFEISDQKIVASAKDYVLHLAQIGKENRSLQRAESIQKIQSLITTLENMESTEPEMLYESFQEDNQQTQGSKKLLI